MNEFSGVNQGTPCSPDFVANWVALLSDRRFGKTYGVMMYAFAICLIHRRASVLYLGLQKESAARIVLPVIAKIQDAYDVPCIVDERNLVVHFPETDAKIHIAGADHPRFAKLLRGIETDLIIVDEAQDFQYQDLETLVKNVLSSTQDDRDGARLFMTGTPGETESGYFYEVCVEGKHPEWYVVHGKPFSNPTNKEKRHNRLKSWALTNPNIYNEPWVRREYFGEWVIDNRLLMVNLTPSINYDTLWRPSRGDEYILSIDWGFSAPAAYVLGTWNKKRHNDLYYLEAWEQKEMRLKHHLEAIEKYQNHPIYGDNLRIIADPGGSSKTIVEELRRTYGIPIENAIKDGKDLILQQVVMETATGNIKIHNVNEPEKPEDNGVAVQWNKLTWKIDPKTKERVEGSPRHTHDACLYLRRAARIEMYSKPSKDERSEGQKIRDNKSRRVKQRLKRKRVFR